MNTLSTDKRELRRLMKERRAAARAHDPAAPHKLREQFLAAGIPLHGIVAGYVAHNSEIDPLPLMQELHARGLRLALPVVAAKDAPLIFRRYAPGDVLEKHGTPPLDTPLPSALDAEPDILLVPLLAFDRTGHRLGYGGGHYDRTLAALRTRKKILAVGLGYAAQEVPVIPAEPDDARLDLIVTEKTVFHPNPAP